VVISLCDKSTHVILPSIKIAGLVILQFLINKLETLLKFNLIPYLKKLKFKFIVEEGARFLNIFGSIDFNLL
jgi:hypothetical protein